MNQHIAVPSKDQNTLFSRLLRRKNNGVIQYWGNISSSGCKEDVRYYTTNIEANTRWCFKYYGFVKRHSKEATQTPKHIYPTNFVQY